MTRIGIRLALLLAIGGTIGCDRVTKHVAATTLAGTPPPIVSGPTRFGSTTKRTPAAF